MKNDHGAAAIGALGTEHSTVEELYLLGQLVRGLGSDNVDTRLRLSDFTVGQGARWLGRCDCRSVHPGSCLVVGSFLRKDHPLFASRCVRLPSVAPKCPPSVPSG